MTEESTVDIYIGESDDVRGRIKQHVGKNLDFWQEVIVATSKDDNLNKAHFRWLEAELIKVAKATAKTNVSNLNSGSAVKLSEPDTADAASYLDELLLLLPLLGVSSFEVPDESRSVDEMKYYLRGREADAEGMRRPPALSSLAGMLVRLRSPRCRLGQRNCARDFWIGKSCGRKQTDE